MLPNFETEFLKLLYGPLPIEGHRNASTEDDLEAGEFITDPDEIKRLVLESEEALDFLIDLHNENLATSWAKVTALEGLLPESTRLHFRYDLQRKRALIKPLPKISQSRSKYLAPLSAYEDSKDSLSKFEAHLSLRKNEALSAMDSTFFFKQTFRVIFPLAARKRHIFLLGSSGSGKSELIKVMIYHDTMKKPGTLVIEPHGDLCKDCSRFKDKGTEIIYISAEFGKLGYYFRYNPFQHDHHSKSLPEKLAFISVKAQELMNAFEIVMSTEFSQNMKRLISNVLQLLLIHRGMNLNDFMLALRPATSSRYEKLASAHPTQSVRLFFEHDFNLKGLAVTKQSVLTRLENAFSNYHLSQIFDCKESSFNLTKLLDQGKCVLVNCNQGLLGEFGAKILGSFLFSELTTHALQRASVPPNQRRAIFTYIDECQNFITERVDKVLSEARKYGLHLLLANQFLSQIENTRLRDSILANTNIKMTGLSSARDFEKMSKELSYESKKVPRLGQGKFIVKVGTYKPIVFQAYDFLVKKSGPCYLDKEAHRARLNQTLARYYTKSAPVKKGTETSASQKGNNQPESPIISIPKPENLL